MIYKYKKPDWDSVLLAELNAELELDPETELQRLLARTDCVQIDSGINPLSEEKEVELDSAMSSRGYVRFEEWEV